MRGAKPFEELEHGLAEALAATPPGGVALACSGGPDSVALTAAAAATARVSGLPLVVLHVNHALRAAAERDEGVALGVASRLGLPFQSTVLQGPAGDEATLRAGRYDALATMALARGCTAIATAHTLEDQVETVLLALVRGTGLRGLAGMPQQRPMGSGLVLLRPLLGRGHGELRAYCHAHGLPYALDETNADARYRRNRLRVLLQHLREVEPSADQAIARLAHLAREEDAYLDERAAEALSLSAAEEGGLDERIGELPRPLLRRVLRLWLGGRDLAFEHLDRLAEAAAQGRRGRFFVRKGEEVVIGAGMLERRVTTDGEDSEPDRN
ncbi:tRNA lysidine(34) synthetase TilS [bacterium]|nr:MAG: tRNA lysidine(34) synthetase TilS [bacterium]